jgi:hypothetical protein
MMDANNTFGQVSQRPELLTAGLFVVCHDFIDDAAQEPSGEGRIQSDTFRQLLYSLQLDPFPVLINGTQLARFLVLSDLIRDCESFPEQ